METNTLHGVARTTFVPLACRARETARPDALLRDPTAVELLKNFGDSASLLMGMSALDQTFTMMRAARFDGYARSFLAAHPDGLVVDIGCGLDTRFNRLDDGSLSWLGLDLPEVIELRRRYLPENERCRTVPGSLFDLAWLEVPARHPGPVIFLAEGVFPYFSAEQVKPLLLALAERFAGGELAFDGLSSFSIKMHNRTHSVLKESGVRLAWGIDDPSQLHACGLRLLDHWGYFDRREPRIGLATLMRYIPALANANFILLYRLGG